MALPMKSKLWHFCARNVIKYRILQCNRALYARTKRALCSGTITYADCPRLVFSGIQPTGVPHIGNYLGAIQHWVSLQKKEKNVIFSIVDLHAVTVPQDPNILRHNIMDMTSCLIACGIDTEKCILFQQSDVLEHVELSWILGSLCSLNKLKLLPQWKQKSSENKEVGSGLLTYPILQSADILLYKGTHVPVGDDQVKHVELTGYLARAFNNRYGVYFPRPECLVTESKRIRSLRNPDVKMSKSDKDVKSYVNLTDTPEIIIEKIKKAKTDFTSAVTYDPEGRPGVSNLIDIHCAFTGDFPEEIVEQSYLLETSEYKKVLAETVINSLKPIRERFFELKNNRDYVESVLKSGADKARTIAAKTSREVKELVGLK